MTSFVHVDQPTEHPGVARAERAVEAIQYAAKNILSPRGAAAMLLAAIVSAMLVVASQVIETWTEGHLLMGWIALWTVAFSSMALAARPARTAVHAIRARLRRSAIARTAARQDDVMWQLAMTDARILADISRAMSADADAVPRR